MFIMKISLHPFRLISENWEDWHNFTYESERRNILDFSRVQSSHMTAQQYNTHLCIYPAIIKPDYESFITSSIEITISFSRMRIDFFFFYFSINSFLSVPNTLTT